MNVTHLDPGPKAVIHVNKQFIAMNAKDGKNRPVYTIKRSGKTIYAREIDILGRSSLISNGTQLSCGARAWIETRAGLDVYGMTTFAEAKEAS